MTRPEHITGDATSHQALLEAVFPTGKTCQPPGRCQHLFAPVQAAPEVSTLPTRVTFGAPDPRPTGHGVSLTSHLQVDLLEEPVALAADGATHLTT